MRRTQRLGRYHLTERIAFGGMAELFRAFTFDEDGFKRDVAIKRLLPHYLEDDAFVDMLTDEFKLVSHLKHANIAEVYELVSLDKETMFISMEYVDGKDLRSTVEKAKRQRERLDIDDIVYIMARALDGLHCAHVARDEHGEPLRIVHRDFSPSNLLIAYDGVIKLCDFGIAKATHNRVKTKAGIIKGKVKYMSPEQAFGRKLDWRSDIFSAGSVLYELVTKTAPFKAPNEVDLIFAVRDATPTPVRELNPQVPPELAQVIEKSMARSRSARYQTAMLFRDALIRFLRGYNPRYRRTKLARFMKTVWREEIERDLRAMEDYVLDVSPQKDLGRNLLAEAQGQDAAYSRFSPNPSKPMENAQVHEQATEIINTQNLGQKRLSSVGHPATSRGAQEPPSESPSGPPSAPPSEPPPYGPGPAAQPPAPGSGYQGYLDAPSGPYSFAGQALDSSGSYGQGYSGGQGPGSQGAHGEGLSSGQEEYGQEPASDQGHYGQGFGESGYQGQGQGYQGQAYPEQGYSEQGYSGQGYSGQGYSEQGYSEQGYSGQGHGEQGYPGQGHGEQGYPEQGYPEQGYPEQGHPGHAYADPAQGGQGYSEQGYSEQGYSEQGYSEQGHADPGGPNVRLSDSYGAEAAYGAEPPASAPEAEPQPALSLTTTEKGSQAAALAAAAAQIQAEAKARADAEARAGAGAQAEGEGEEALDEEGFEELEGGAPPDLPPAGMDVPTQPGAAPISAVPRPGDLMGGARVPPPPGRDPRKPTSPRAAQAKRPTVPPPPARAGKSVPPPKRPSVRPKGPEGAGG